MSAPPDVAVVGAGIAGAACALFLARAGARVEVLERAFPASGTSGACEGNLLAWDKEPEHELPLHRRSRTLWDALGGELEDFELEGKGSIMVAETDAELEAAARLAAGLRERGIAGEVLDAAALRAEEPAAADDLPGGVLFPGDAQVEPRRAVVAMLREAERLGARVRTGATVRRVVAAERAGSAGATDARGGSRSGGTATARGAGTRPAGAADPFVELAGGERVRAGRVVVAAGVWTPALLEQDLPVHPRKGQIVVTERAPGLFRRKLSEASYLTAIETADAGLQVAMVVESTRAGTVLLGSSRELVGFDTRADPAVAARIAARAARFFPVLRELRALRVYAGLRPFVPDHKPAIGHIAPGVLVATGHEGAGIALGPATGELVAALVTGAGPAVDPAPFDPRRFTA